MPPSKVFLALAILVTSYLASCHASPRPSERKSNTVWQPAVGSTWQIQLSTAKTSNQTGGFPIWDIDLFDTKKSTIKGLQSQGAKVICYFSAGSFEDWRPDASSFKSSDYGKALDGWEGEYWLNTKSTNVRKIMVKRLKLAASKGCDGVDPDNTDGYQNKNGLGLTKKDAINYVNYLALQAKALGLSTGLKNSGDIIPSVINNMQWSVNEQCHQYKECDIYSPFIKAGKPVFNIEYPKGEDTSNSRNITSTKLKSLCNDGTSKNFSLVIKNINLNSWIELCPGVSPSGA